MKTNVWFIVVVVLFFSNVLCSATDNFFEDIFVNSCINESSIEIYFVEKNIEFRIPLDEDRLKKICLTKSVESAKYKQVKTSMCYGELEQLKKINPIKLKEKRDDIRLLVYISCPTKHVTITMGSYLKINNQVFQYDQRVWNIFEKIILCPEEKK